MSRTLLLIALFTLAGLAHAAGDPVHHSPGGSCPPQPRQAAEGAVAEFDVSAAPEATDSGGQARATPRSSAGESGRARLRWHSFVPGMFK